MARDKRQRRREGARRSMEAQVRQAESRQRRGRRRIFTMAGGGVALVTLLVVVVLLTRGPQVGEAVPALPGNHNPPYAYNSSPPTSGNHLPVLAPYGFTAEILPQEAVVHNMEHGAVVIWYWPNDPALEQEVRSLVQQLGPQCIVATPFRDMDEAVAATAWGRILRQDSYDEAQVLEFVDAYRSRLGPEAGLCLGDRI